MMQEKVNLLFYPWISIIKASHMICELLKRFVHHFLWKKNVSLNASNNHLWDAWDSEKSSNVSIFLIAGKKIRHALFALLICYMSFHVGDLNHDHIHYGKHFYDSISIFFAIVATHTLSLSSRFAVLICFYREY